MAFILSDLASALAWWRREDIPTGGADPLNWDDVISAWRLSATGTTRAAYSATGIAGGPCLSLDGINDVLRTATTKTLRGSRTVLAVCQGSYFWGGGPVQIGTATPIANDANMRLSLNTYASTRLDLNSSGASIYQRCSVAARTFLEDTDFLITASISEQYGILRVNGRQCPFDAGGTFTATSLGNSTESIYCELGKQAGSFWKCRIAEVAVLSDATSLGECEITYAEGYLAHKYGITLNSGHPFYAAAPTSGPSSGGGNTLAALRHGIHMGNRGVAL